MTFITGDQILAHLVGDYILQSHWMATEKTKQSVAAGIHALTYTLPFLLITQNPWAISFIAGTHFLIDRFRLARYVVWIKNQAASERVGLAWADCQPTGYPKDVPPWLSVWLLIIADNVLHLVCNGIALAAWG